jgi:TolB-like protein/Tfp pilus assembly protein PilF
MKKLIQEIHRRSLWQVVGIYLAGSYIALEVVDLLSANAGLPEWFPGLALGLLVLGLPVVIATAFVQEGVRRSDEGAGSAGSAGSAAHVEAERATSSMPSVAHGLFTWRNAIIGGAAAALLWGGVAVGWVLFGRTDSAARAVAVGESVEQKARTLAVLPFATRSEMAEDRWFAEGMHDDLLTQLSKIETLAVISRTSVLRFADTRNSIREIASELQVNTVLEGGVQRAGDRIRVNVQLIDAATDGHLWAETYDEELTAANVFAIQTDLARKIADALHATLSPAVARRIAKRPTESLEAYDLYARGRYSFTHRGMNGEDLPETMALFERAIAADSTFADAWAALANAYLAAWNWRKMPQETAGPRARAAVDRALALDPDVAEAHVAHVRLLMLEQRPGDAEAAIQRALELNPGSAEVHAVHARLLEATERPEEALREARRAVSLDPLTVGHRHDLADRLYYMGKFDAAIEESQKILDMTPGDWYAWYNIGWSHGTAGRGSDAVAAFHESLRSTVENAPAVRLGLAFAFAISAQRDSALSYLASVADEFITYDAVLVHHQLGNADRAFQLLETVLSATPNVLRSISRDPSAVRLRADPRFTALIARLGLD